MKTNNKKEELWQATWDAHIAKDAAIASRNSAWDVYIDAAKCLYAARKSTQQAAMASRDKAWELHVDASKFLNAARKNSQVADIAYADYKKYFDGINSTDNTEQTADITLDEYAEDE